MCCVCVYVCMCVCDVAVVRIVCSDSAVCIACVHPCQFCDAAPLPPLEVLLLLPSTLQQQQLTLQSTVRASFIWDIPSFLVLSN